MLQTRILKKVRQLVVLKVVVAMNNTIKIMKQIDETIDSHAALRIEAENIQFKVI